MARISAPSVVLVVVAALADAAGAHSLAFDALVLAVPAAAVAALAALAVAVDPGEPLAVARAWLLAVVLLLVLVSAAVRAPVRGADSVPRLATSALVAALVVLGAAVAGALWPWLRRRFRPRLTRRAVESGQAPSAARSRAA